MKKLFFIFAFSFAAITLFAQKEHMKFAGIPLTGTITQFQAKLQAKGFIPDAKLNPHLSVGTRAFYGGTFIGKKARAAVYYDTETKIVHGAKAFFEDYTESKAKEEIEYLKVLLMQKYADEGYISEDTKNGLPTFTIDTPLGSIYVYSNKNEDLTGYPYHFSVHIEYSDSANSQKHHNNIMDDL